MKSVDFIFEICDSVFVFSLCSKVIVIIDFILRYFSEWKNTLFFFSFVYLKSSFGSLLVLYHYWLSDLINNTQWIIWLSISLSRNPNHNIILWIRWNNIIRVCMCVYKNILIRKRYRDKVSWVIFGKKLIHFNSYKK